MAFCFYVLRVVSHLVGARVLHKGNDFFKAAQRRFYRAARGNITLNRQLAHGLLKSQVAAVDLGFDTHQSTQMQLWTFLSVCDTGLRVRHNFPRRPTVS